MGFEGMCGFQPPFSALAMMVFSTAISGGIWAVHFHFWACQMVAWGGFGRAVSFS